MRAQPYRRPLVRPSARRPARPRLHDIGRSGWWVLISPIPFVGFVVMLAFTCEDSEPGTNEFGPSPKQPQDETPMGFGWESTQS